MKTLRMFVSGFVVAFSLASFPPARGEGSDDSGPKVAFDREEHDFGRVLDSKKVETEFTITNAGAAVLEIERVTTTCGCTVSEPESKKVDPGAQTKLKVRFDPAGRSGAWRGAVAIHSNDPATPAAHIRLAAEVVPEVRISTTYVYFGEILKGAAESREVALDNVEFPGLAVEKFHIEGEHFRVEMVESTGGAPGGRFLFRVSVLDTAPYDYVEGNLYVLTNYERSPLFRVFLIARVQGHVQLSRPRIDFGILHRSPNLTGRREKLEITSLDESIEIQEAKVDLDFLEVAIEVVQPGKLFHVLVIVKDGLAPTSPDGTWPARIQGSLALTTTSAERPRIDVPIFMIVKTEEE